MRRECVHEIAGSFAPGNENIIEEKMRVYSLEVNIMYGFVAD